MAWGKAGTTTLSGSGANMTLTDMTASKFNQILCHVSGTSASTFCETLFNSDTGSNYANRASQNGLPSNFTRVSQSDLNMFESYSNTTGAFLVSYFVNISGEEKLGISQSVREGTSGAGNAPVRDENAYKWTNTSAQITSSSFTPQSGTVNTDSNLSALGSDITPAAAIPALTNVQDNSLFIEPSTAKRYWFDEAVTYTDEDIIWDSTTAINVSISGNTVTKTSSVAWDSVARSTQTWTSRDEPTLEFTMVSDNLKFEMVGFGKGTLGTNYATGDFTIYAQSVYIIYENNVQKYTSTIVPSSSDALKVTMDSNGLVKYWLNGSVLYTSTQTASGTYYAQFAGYQTGASTTMTYSTTPAFWTIESPPKSGLKLWLDASDSTTITKDGSDLVSAWNDKSGQANHVSQATATNQPLWVDAVYNSLPTIRFDGVDNYMFRNTWTGGALTQPNTIFIVCEIPTGASTKFIYDSLHTGGRNAFFSRGTPSEYSVYAGAAPNFGTRNTEFAQFMLEFNGSSTFVRRNKTSIGSSIVAGSLDMSGIYLASNGAATIGQFGDIDISEVLVYAGQLSTADRDDIEEYFTAKWGL